MCDRPPKRRTQSDDRSDIRRPLRRDCAGDNSSQTMADQMDLPPGLSQGLLNRVLQLASDEEVGPFGIEPYAGKERVVPDSSQPLMQRGQVSIGTQKSGEE